jgi:phosphinothricin acetyltransferase
MHIRPVTAHDAEQIAEIYNWYVLNTIISFETEAVSPADMRARIAEKRLKYDWLVAEENQAIIGYAYYGPFRPRAAYYHTVESTIYLKQNSMGRGLGRALYGRLIESAKDHGFRSLIGVISLPNPQSLALHQKLGFVEVGVLKQVGYKFGDYIDVALWQLSVVIDSQ